VRRRLAVGLAVVVAVVVGAVVVPGLGGGPEPAYGRPRILEAPLVRVTGQIARGLSARTVLGAGAPMVQAREARFARGVAYVAGSSRGWCMVFRVRMPGSPDGTPGGSYVEQGTTCTPAAEFDRVGIWGGIGTFSVAMVPQGVPDPTVVDARGRARALRPSRYGVVTTELGKGEKLVLHATHGDDAEVVLPPAGPARIAPSSTGVTPPPGMVTVPPAMSGGGR
ncbi:hypothetical protein ACVU7I_18940, partial [Patulibacter sp. S7RM1-6]